MNIIYNDKIKANPELFSAIQDATRFLESDLGPSGNSATIEWDLVEALDAERRVRPLVSVTISAGPDRAEALYDSEILGSPRQLRFAVLEVWGDLLARRSERMTQDLLARSGETIK